MKQKLIKLSDDHYIILDDSEIKIGDWIYDSSVNVIEQVHNTIIYVIESGNGGHYKKITHSTKCLEWWDGGIDIVQVWNAVKPLNLSEIKELLGEVNVNKLSEIYSNKQIELIFGDRIKRTNSSRVNKKLDIIVQQGVLLLSTVGKTLFENGYNKALEDNKNKKYTEEDIRLAFTNGFAEYTARSFDCEDYIRYIQPKTEWEVEFVDEKLKLIEILKKK